MPNAATVLDATPPAAELLAANAQGMSWRAWVDAGKPVSKIALVDKTAIGKQNQATRPYAPYRSKWEAQYAAYLTTLKSAGQIADWAYEPDRLDIGIGAKYTPDFRVTHLSGQIEYREVKGYRREAAIVRIKAAAKQYPAFRFLIVTKKHGQWDHQPIRETR